MRHMWGHAWLSASVTSAIEGKRCKWMGRPEVNANTVSTMRPRRGPRRQAVRTSDRAHGAHAHRSAEARRSANPRSARAAAAAEARRPFGEEGAGAAQPRRCRCGTARSGRERTLNMRAAESVAYEAVALA